MIVFRWLIRQVDSLVGTVLAASLGIAASQILAFMQQYQQRLGGHLAEALLNLRQIQNGTAYKDVSASARERLVATATDRVVELEAARDAIDNAGPFSKPFVFFTHLDPGIAGGTLRSYQPALPLDVTSLAYAALGMIIAWLIYNAIKSPARLFRRR